MSITIAWPNPSVSPDAPSAWLLSSFECQRRGSVQRLAGAQVTLYR
jgi:hypothetical protein